MAHPRKNNGGPLRGYATTLLLLSTSFSLPAISSLLAASCLSPLYCLLSSPFSLLSTLYSLLSPTHYGATLWVYTCILLRGYATTLRFCARILRLSPSLLRLSPFIIFYLIYSWNSKEIEGKFPSFLSPGAGYRHKQ